MHRAAVELPEPAAFSTFLEDLAATGYDPAQLDLDADGFSNSQDTCPRIPNRAQNAVCGPALVNVLDQSVFLKSRTFAIPTGVPPTNQLAHLTRVHAMIHLAASDDGVVLTDAQRQALSTRGVELLHYLPHRTYAASLPRNAVASVGALPWVEGVSAYQPSDKVAPQVRLRGPLEGRIAGGTSMSLDVEFFADVSTSVRLQDLQVGATSWTHLYDSTYRVEVPAWGHIQWWSSRDSVEWITDVPGEGEDDSTNGQEAVGADILPELYGYTGENTVFSVTESGLIAPLDLPDWEGRASLGNNPIFAPESNHVRGTVSVLVGNGDVGPERVGLLPQASVVSFSNIGPTLKRIHFGIPQDSRIVHNALLNSNSWSKYNCAKIGEYTRRAKLFDRAAYDVGISILKSAGNGRAPNDPKDDFGNCSFVPDLHSLPHSNVGKNSLVVGNVKVSTAQPYTLDGMRESSSAGPTADGRLKPDVVAPGTSLFAVGYDNSTEQRDPNRLYGGTSAATPFAGGIVGLLGEAFLANSENPNAIAPARYRAILTHTARDIDASGPDYGSGYGVVQPEAAMHIADQWSSWGREGVLDSATTVLVFPFTVSSPHSFFKATLAWDDEEGEHTATMALKNDLDLTLVSPSGAVFRPYDLSNPPPVGNNNDPGASPCTAPACQDRLNNLEMVRADPLAGSYTVEQGPWQARVEVHRLVSQAQAFSLVLTPDCPVLIDRDTVLGGDLTCPLSGRGGAAVQVTADNVTLDCNNRLIRPSTPGATGFVADS
ncbi:MAG: S8 family serine peptidase, partial [Myxococcota bacterium]